MAHSYGGVLAARSSATSNPISRSVTVSVLDTVLVVLLKTVGVTDRTGGALSFGGYPLTQAGTTQKAAASPECGAELWYLCNPPIGTYDLLVPNSGALTIFTTVVSGRAKAGGTSAFDAVAGANGTSTNPSPGSLTCAEDGEIVFGIVATGAQTWAPSAQAGTNIANTDDGAHGGGEQYALRATKGAFTLNWTFGTSDDWGAVAAAFREIAPNTFENYHRIGWSG